MMPIMNIVWPLTGLYFPIIRMWAYYRMGRDKGRSNNKDQHQHDNHHKKPFLQSAFVSTTQCSSGCSLGDVAGVPIVAVTEFRIGGDMLYWNFLGQLD